MEGGCGAMDAYGRPYNGTSCVGGYKKYTAVKNGCEWLDSR